MTEPKYGVYYRDPKTRKLKRRGDYETAEQANEVATVESHRTGQAHWPINHQEQAMMPSKKIMISRVYQLRRRD